MGNCSGSPGKKSDAPVPKMNARKMGLDCRKCRNADLFKQIQNKYIAVKVKHKDLSKEEAHEKTMEDRYLQDMIERFADDMDYDFDISRDARNEQSRMLSDMGDDNPENSIPDIPGASGAWESAKRQAIKKAVVNVTSQAVAEELKAHAESIANEANKVELY
eukprot:TRINITY_DN4988_c2_g1_i1.p1 TRINITY_DN4988_c2_g1~~TRINITY_DN4988_c2_g1_i1.p1  ORF type:complete len:162 (+),score=41.48 TRINITY_DN4988_c2_g1_i1:58-543(+)